MTPFLRTVAWLPVFLAAAAPAAAHFGAQPPKDVYLAKRIAEIRDATARFQDPAAARAAGYVQASGNLPLLGYRFAQPGITAVAFDRPAALFYLKQGERWQLAGVEYAVAGEGRPAVEPFPGIRWTWEPAVCRYADWHELQERARDRCPATHPEGAALAAWQPAYWSIRVWVWYPNPSGMFARVNPLLAPFDDHSLPPGGFWTWDAWAADAEYSNRNHHVAGWIVLLIGGLMLPQAFQGRFWPRLRPAWTILAMAIGVLILVFSDPEGWPVGDLTLAQSLASEEVREHKLSGVIVLALGLVEFLRLRGALRSRVWGLFLPVLSIGAGAILLQHQHAVSNFGYLGRANLPHVTEGLTAILIGVTKILADWGLWRGRAAAVAWPGFTLALALQLILYTE
ncbi:MAG TPA: hypothetical protein VED18_03820 [Candidatus Sulfotelmatobacter sp.]|nr:hypothetical protein [Candidatus Sulfotelmatobacter sp.]